MQKVKKAHVYDAIAVIDTVKEDKRRRGYPTYGVMPIWRWLWCQIRRLNIKIDFVSLDFSDPGVPDPVPDKYDFFLIYIDHFIPEWMPEFINRLQENANTVSLAFCGFLPTVKKEQLNCLFPDVQMILAGPLEVSLTQFCEELYAKVQPDTLEPDGYCHFPAEGSLTDDLRAEYADTFLASGIGAVQASAGCPRKCSFCRHSAFYHELYPGVFRQFSMPVITDEIKILNTTYHIGYIRLMDSNFLGSGQLAHKRAKEFAEAVRTNDLRIRFAFHCRSDSLTAETVAMLADAGLHCVTMGIESMSPEQLSRFGKQETISHHKEAVRLLTARGISVQGYGILADPLVTRSELMENLRGLYELSHDIQIVLNERMILYPSTDYYQKNKNEISNIQPVEASLGTIMEYDFADEWCNNYFKYIEQTSIWLLENIVKISLLRPDAQGTNEQLIRSATSCRLSALIDIVDLPDPDSGMVEQIRNEALDQINRMLLAK